MFVNYRGWTFPVNLETKKAHFNGPYCSENKLFLEDAHDRRARDRAILLAALNDPAIHGAVAEIDEHVGDLARTSFANRSFFLTLFDQFDELREGIIAQKGFVIGRHRVVADGADAAEVGNLIGS